MSSYAARLIGVVTAVVVAVVLIVLYIALYLTSSPGDASASAIRTASGAQLYLATVAAAETNDAHPTWVSYYVTDANDRNWRHATVFDVPAHSLVHVTIFQFDGQSGLRNPFLSQARGIVGGTFTLNGKATQQIGPDTASHIFAIPQLDVSVPLEGIPDSAKNPCANAPCSLSTDHYTISFTFRTRGRGLFRWQCFVPCAAGFIQGFGGPMQTYGYMDGFVHVV